MKRIPSMLLIAMLIVLGCVTISFAEQTYIVKQGDNLWEIAQKYNVSWKTLSDHNKLINPNLIFPNQKLTIPAKPGEAEFSQKSYYVKKGDKLWEISKKYNISLDALIKFNNIKNPNQIYISQEIKIPNIENETPKPNNDIDNDSIIVSAKTGTYKGQKNKGVAEFLGIRYAAPIERWKAAKDVLTTSKDIIDATEWGASCIQPYDEVEIASQWDLDEDCLTLNIWTRDSNKKNKPVMMFIHGGGATQGGTYDPLYHGDDYIRNLPVAEDAVFITINYRLGIFGSLDLSILDGYSKDYDNAINLAILDQVQALKWINENVEAWGGDPENVTIFGQSAGGGAVCTLLTMPQATQYFNKAIIESGMIFNRQCTPEKLKENSKKVYEILQVNSVEELMKLSGDEIYDKYIDKIFKEVSLQQRVADGKIIPLDGWNALVDGSAKDIKIMIGCTDGEYDFYSTDWDDFPKPIRNPDYIWAKIKGSKESKGNASTVLSPVDYPDVVKEYMALDVDQVKRMQDLYNDIHYRQGSIYVAEALSKYTDVYMYYWTWAPDPEVVIELMGEDAEVSPFSRAMHCMDLVFVFGTIEEGYPELAGPGDLLPSLLVDQTQAAYYNFAKTGNPNNKLIPEWKPYNTDTRYTMVISGDDEWQLESDIRSEDRIILNKIRPLTEK